MTARSGERLQWRIQARLHLVYSPLRAGSWNRVSASRPPEILFFLHTDMRAPLKTMKKIFLRQQGSWRAKDVFSQTFCRQFFPARGQTATAPLAILQKDKRDF